MTTYNKNGSAADGHCGHVYTLDYNVARDATTADSINIASATLVVGYQVATPALYRGYLYFDTSLVPSNAVISSSYVRVYVPANCPAQKTGGQDFFLYTGEPTYPSEPLVVGDFDRTLYSGGVSGKINIVGADDEWKTFTLTSDGIDTIDVDGVTKFCIRSEFDLTPTIPTTGMEAYIRSADSATNKPFISITYDLNPLITTDAADGLGPTYVTGNGTVDSQGDGSVTKYGFIYNDDGSDPVNIAGADNDVESVDLAGGVFSASLTALESAFTYNYRAYMTTSIGTGYGDAVEFTTSAAAAALSTTTVSATDADVETATLNGSVSRPAGDLVEEYGFVYKLGGDPGTPADPTTADNYTETSADVEGAFNDDLTGLAGGSQYMFRAYAKSDAPDIDYGGLGVFSTLASGTATLYSSTSDGVIECTSSSAQGVVVNWNAAHDDSGSGSGITTVDKDVASDNMSAYIINNINGYTIERGYLFFDTSSVPTGATIVSATLSLYIRAIYDTASREPSLIVQKGATGYPHDALQDADYDYTKYSGNYGSLAFGDAATSRYNDIALNSSIIVKGGDTNLCVREGVHDVGDIFLDIGTTESTGFSYYASEKGTTYRPKLVVVYTEPLDPIFPKINIGDTWKDVDSMQINIGDAWKDVEYVLINVGGEWKPLTS